MLRSIRTSKRRLVHFHVVPKVRSTWKTHETLHWHTDVMLRAEVHRWHMDTDHVNFPINVIQMAQFIFSNYLMTDRNCHECKIFRKTEK